MYETPLYYIADYFNFAIVDNSNISNSIGAKYIYRMVKYLL